MIVSEADAGTLPSYNTYAVGERVFRPLVNSLGGYTVHNAEVLRPLDGQSYFLSPNHRSNWDSFVLGLSMLDLPELTSGSLEGPLQPRAVHFMAKDSLWKYPVVKQFIERCGAYKVKRYQGIGLDNGQLDHITKLDTANAVMCIYPEGTRNRTAEDIEAIQHQKLKTTIGFLALKYGIPIVPVGIAGPVKGRKMPRTQVFGEPIFVERSSAENETEFKQEKYDLMNLLHARMSKSYQTAWQLHRQ